MKQGIQDQFYEDKKEFYKQLEIEKNKDGKTVNLFRNVIRQIDSVTKTLNEKRRFERSLERIEKSFTQGQPLKRE